MRSGLTALPGQKRSLISCFVLIVFLIGFLIGGTHISYSSHDEAVNLTNSDQPSNDPSITVSTDGTLLIAWRETSASSIATIIGESINGDNLDAFVNASVNQLEARNPDIDSSESGVVFVVWSDAALGEIFIANSSDNFSSPVNISNNSGDSKLPKVTRSSTGEVYVAWVDQGLTSPDIFIANSSDNFATPINISNNDFESVNPDIGITSTGVVSVVWEEVEIGEIFIANSSDNFATPINISNNDGGAFSPRIDVSITDEIFVVWTDFNTITFFVDVYLANSSDNFATPINISNNDFADSSTPDIAASDTGDVFVVWDEFDYNTGSFELRASASFSGGSFGPSINVVTSSTFSATTPRVATSGTGQVYVTWVDQGPTSTDIFLKGNLQFEGASITIASISDTSPRWAIDDITINGTVNGFSNDDTIQVDWGDGSLPDEVEIATTDGSWSASHTYDASAVATNPNQVTASLVGADDTVKAVSDSWQIDVARHTTAILSNHIPSVTLGNNVTVTGQIMDVETGNPGISNTTIIFSGTGASSLGSAVSGPDGAFSSSGTAPSIAGELYSVQAMFDGNELYLGTEGASKSYNVVGSSTTEFDLSTGSGTLLNLTGFGATITFDKAVNSGSVFVESCESPASPRYIDLEICLSVSLGAELSSDNVAHLGISYADAVLPEGFTDADVSIFYEGLSGIVDLTESRDAAARSVTAGSTDFGKFIVGIGLHEAQSSLEIRSEIFLGENVIVSNPPRITTDKSEYLIDDTASLTIADINANADITEPEIISAFVSSTTSGNDGITVSLVETDKDSGVFTGTFSFSTESSSGSTLQASDGDELTIDYDSFLPRFNVTLDGIVEAGVADISTFEMPDPGPIKAFMGAVDLELVDSANSENGNITVTMLYDKELLSGVPLINLKMFHKFGESEWEDVTVPDGNNDQVGLIIGKTNSAGLFVIGCDSGQQGCGGPGGGGGGLPRPGTGVLLDRVAKVVGRQADSPENNDSGGGGGGGGSRSTAITPTPSGSEVETSVRTLAGTVTVAFENVEDGSGQLRVSSNSISGYEEIFDDLAFMLKDNDEHGILHLNGKTYSTAGQVFDIDVSAIRFEGTVSVTIPFDELVINSFEVSESQVRFLHYDEDKAAWEDSTIAVDEQANTVTGVLIALSPVVAAIITGGSPELQSSSMGIISTSFSADSGQANLTANLSNNLPVNQEFVLLVQVVDENNVAQTIHWQKGAVSANQNSTITMSWSGMGQGQHTVQLLLLTNLESAYFLAEPASFEAVI